MKANHLTGILALGGLLATASCGGYSVHIEQDSQLGGRVDADAADIAVEVGLAVSFTTFPHLEPNEDLDEDVAAVSSDPTIMSIRPTIKRNQFVTLGHEVGNVMLTFSSESGSRDVDGIVEAASPVVNVSGEGGAGGGGGAGGSGG